MGSHLARLIPEWLAFSRQVRVPLGLSTGEAISTARSLYRVMLSHEGQPLETKDDEGRDLCHALVSVVLPTSDLVSRTDGSQAVYSFIRQTMSLHEDEEERLDLLRATAEIGWRALGLSYRDIAVARRRLSGTEGVSCLADGRLRAVSLDRRSLSFLLRELDELSLLIDTDAQRLVTASVKLFDDLVASPAQGLFDEKEYALGELARMAAFSSRVRGQWEQAESWFRVAETRFSQTLQPETGYAKVAFGRVGLFYAQHQYRDVAESAGGLAKVFDAFDMPDFSAKSRLAQAAALKSMGSVAEALDVLDGLRKTDLVASRASLFVRVHTQIADCCDQLNRSAAAAAALAAAARHVGDTDASLVTADYRLVYGNFLRGQGRLSEAAVALRRGKWDYLSVGALSLAAYGAILVAETALLLGFTDECHRELRWALPIVEQHGLLPEGCAAIALVQESIRRQQLDPVVLQEVAERLRRPRLK